MGNGEASTAEQIAITKPLEQGISEVREALGEKTAQILPETKPITGVTREDFTSRSFSQEEGPTKQAVDGTIHKVVFGDGSETYVLRHKTTGGNPFSNPAVFGAFLPEGGIDARTWETFIYEWDGNETIKATAPDGKVTEVKGQQWGTPDAMLPTLRQSLGHPRDTETFVSALSQSNPIQQ